MPRKRARESPSLLQLLLPSPCHGGYCCSTPMAPLNSSRPELTLEPRINSPCFALLVCRPLDRQTMGTTLQAAGLGNLSAVSYGTDFS